MCSITTNINGIPYIPTINVNVSDTSVNLVLGFRNIQQVGYFSVENIDKQEDRHKNYHSTLP